MCLIVSLLEKAVYDTLLSLQTRGILKAYKRDLIAELVKPDRLAFSEAMNANANHPQETDIFENFYPEEGESMYGNFKFRGGKPKRTKKSKTSKRRSRKRI
jgi:hypothetical protein